MVHWSGGPSPRRVWMSRSCRVAARIVSVVLATTSPAFTPWLPAAHAQPKGGNPLDKARAQFQQGLALETAGDWAGALSLFVQVAAVKLTPQVRFHVGLCEEHLG